VGTIPLVSTINSLSAPTKQYVDNIQASAPPAEYWEKSGVPPPTPWIQPPPEMFSAYPDLPPPTYAESVWGFSNVKAEDDDENTGGDFDFVPRYVSYATQY